MKREELIKVMNDGKIVGLTFVKKDGSIRVMACRLGVTAHLRGGDKAYDDASYQLLTVYDMRHGYRSVPVNRILEVRKSGRVVWASSDSNS